MTLKVTLELQIVEGNEAKPLAASCSRSGQMVAILKALQAFWLRWFQD